MADMHSKYVKIMTFRLVRCLIVCKLSNTSPLFFSPLRFSLSRLISFCLSISLSSHARRWSRNLHYEISIALASDAINGWKSSHLFCQKAIIIIACAVPLQRFCVLNFFLNAVVAVALLCVRRNVDVHGPENTNQHIGKFINTVDFCVLAFRDHEREYFKNDIITLPWYFGT